MYSKLNLETEQIELLRQYFDAFSNLYGIITMRKAFEIIGRQNRGSISEEDLLAFAEISRHENHYYYILSMDELYSDELQSEPMERELVGEYLLVCGFDDYYNVAKGHLGKEYYVPSKTELWASLKTSFDKNQLCTAFAVSPPLRVRQHAFEGFPCNCRTYLIFA